MKRAAMIAIVPIAALLVGGVALAGGTAPRVPRVTGSRDLTVISKHVTFTNADIGDDGPSIGDELVFTGTDWNRDEVRKVGRVDGHCVYTERTDVKDAWVEQCFITHSLVGGEITLQGTFDQSSSEGQQFAITGGTGNYRNVRGWVGLRFRRQFRFELHLLP
jgi:Dirigent-like protein